jgi:hypothetical protein
MAASSIHKSTTTPTITMTTAGLVSTATLGAKQQMTTKTPEEEAVVVYYLRPRSNPKKKKRHYSLLQAVKWTKPTATPATAALPDAAQLFAWQLPYLSIYLSLPFPSLPFPPLDQFPPENTKSLARTSKKEKPQPQ